MKSAWFTMLSNTAFCAAIVGVFTSSPACADSWLPPEQWSETSACGEFRFTAIPPPFDGHTPVDETARPTGVLERRKGEDEWEEVWRAPLVNDIAPTDGLVTDDGAHVVTFNNWYTHGHGENVIVIYDAQGTLVRSMELTDLIPQLHKDLLWHSFSSVDWLRDKGVNAAGKMAYVDIHGPGESFVENGPEPLRFRIRLTDGEVILPRADQWQETLALSHSLGHERFSEALRYEHLKRVPITAPDECSEDPWRFYIREVIARRAPVGSDNGHASMTFLLPPDGEEARRRFANFVGSAASLRATDNRMAVAAPCASGELIRAAQEIAQRAKVAGQTEPFKALSLYVSAPKAQFVEVDAILGSTGAKLVWLDPDLPVPQREDRMPDNDDEVAELKALTAELAAKVKADRAAGYVFD